MDLTSGGEDSDPPTTSLVFVVSDSGARRLGNAIETVDETESGSADTTTALVHPELVSRHTEQLIEIASTALETSGQGVVGSIPNDDDKPIDLDWVREHGPPAPSIEVRGFRAEWDEEKEESTEASVFMIESDEDTDQDDDEQADNGQERAEAEDGEHEGNEQEQGVDEREDRQKQAHYRISVELSSDENLSQRFDASYLDDVPANNLESEQETLHIPNPEIGLFLDVALDSDQEDDLRQSIEEIDITDKRAEIAVFKAPVEYDSIHKELIIEIFPHFNLIDLRDDLRPLINEAGGKIRTEELPYFVKYSTKHPYYITHDVSSLTNPERDLTDSEDYYNERRIELIQSQTDYRSVVSAENMTLALSEVKAGDKS